MEPWFLRMASRKAGLRDWRGEHLEDEEVLVGGVSPLAIGSLGEGVADLGGVGTAEGWLVLLLVLLTR